MVFAGNTMLIVGVLVFVAVMLLLEGLYLLWRGARGPRAKKLRHRLHAVAAARAGLDQQVLRQRPAGELPWLSRMLQHAPRLQAVDRFIMQSGLEWTVTRLLTVCALCFTVVFVAAGLLHQPLLVSLPAALAAAALPAGVVELLRVRRMRRIERQLPDALDLMGRGLRAGHAFSATLKMAGDELPEPIAAELRTVHDEINFGVSMQDALTHLAERVPLTDLRYFVVAVLIQRESGGNLTEILGNLSRLIRDRLKLLARVRVLSSEGRMSMWILMLLPVALAGLMNAFNPKFMSPLWTDPMGLKIVKTMLVLMGIGFLILRKLVRIRY